MRTRTLLFLTLTLASLPAQARADGDNRGPDREEFALDGAVPPSCRLGDPEAQSTSIELAALADSEGRLRSNFAVPTRNLVESFCNSPSTLSITARRLSGGSNRTPADGFAREIDFTVRVSGWTDDPAVFLTSQTGTQEGARRYQPRPRQSDIQVDFSDFRTSGGPSLRLIAAPRYEGVVVISLSPTP